MIGDFSVGMIYAQDGNGGIGKEGNIPWRCKGDSNHFWRTIDDTPVVVGSNTYKTAQRFFERRRGEYPNVFVMTKSRPAIYKANPINPTRFFAYVNTMNDIQRYLKLYNMAYVGNKARGLWVCGGSQIYSMFLPFTDIFVETDIEGDYECDTFMPWDTIDPPESKPLNGFSIPCRGEEVFAFGYVYARKTLTSEEIGKHSDNLLAGHLVGEGSWR